MKSTSTLRNHGKVLTLRIMPFYFCRNKPSRKGDLSDVSKPLKAEKEKRDALANIDINNYAGKLCILLIAKYGLKQLVCISHKQSTFLKY